MQEGNIKSSVYHKTSHDEDAEQICEFMGCSRIATEYIREEIGGPEKIILNLCKGCKLDFYGNELFGSYSHDCRDIGGAD